MSSNRSLSSSATRTADLQRRGELFATERLGDAMARLYERYADLLLDGPARVRAAATARSVATMLGPFDPRMGDAFASSVEFVDHRALIACPRRVAPTSCGNACGNGSKGSTTPSASSTTSWPRAPMRWSRCFASAAATGLPAAASKGNSSRCGSSIRTAS